MINYYEELGLPQNESVKVLNHELNKQEQIWRRRQPGDMENSGKRLVLIKEAREKFKDEQSKSEYDLQLKRSRQKSYTGNEQEYQSKVFDEMWGKMDWYYKNREYDLAKTQLDEAITYMNPECVASTFYDRAANVCNENGDYEAALDFINKAIVKRNRSDYHITKGVIFKYKHDSICENETKTLLIDKAYEEFLKAYELSVTEEKKVTRGIAAGWLAFICYYYRNVCGKNRKDDAERYAKEAIEYGDEGKKGEQVLNDIEEKRECVERREEAKRRAKLEEDKRIEENRRRQEEKKRKKDEINEEHKKKLEEYDGIWRRRRFTYGVGWVVWVIFAVINLCICGVHFYEKEMFSVFDCIVFLALSVVGTGFSSYSAFLYHQGPSNDYNNDYYDHYNRLCVCVFWGSIVYSLGGGHFCRVKNGWPLFIIPAIIMVIAGIIGKNKLKMLVNEEVSHNDKYLDDLEDLDDY